MLKQGFWDKKKVLLTGHTGFKGSWLSLCLAELGAQVIGYALKPNTTPNLFHLLGLDDVVCSIIGDVRHYETLEKICEEHQPDIIIHMAAQSLVHYSYEHPLETYQTNILGTANVLECFRQSKSAKVCLNITTDKCYENHERETGYTEEDRLGGADPYSSSKACSELMTAAYRQSFFSPQSFHHCEKGIATARAGNVIGGGDWSEDRLIPDYIRAVTLGLPFKVRRPKSIRPWQYVLEPLYGYLKLVEKLWLDPVSYSGAWNFGPNAGNCQSVESLIHRLSKAWPLEIHWEKPSVKDFHETSCLKLDSTKANRELDWKSKMPLDAALDATIKWYDGYLKSENLFELSKEQIVRYFQEEKEELLV